MTIRFLTGCYTQRLPHVDGQGEGIVAFDLDPDSGALSRVSVTAGLVNPSYLAFDPARELVYAVEERSMADGASVVTLKYDRISGNLTVIARNPAHGDWPCHVALDRAGRRLFLSNYLSGSLTVWALDGQGLPQGAAIIQRQGHGVNPERQEDPHVHCAVPTPDGLHVLICDAGTDEIARHALTGVGGIAPQPDMILRAPDGALPRHLVFHPDGQRIFVVHELGNHVTAYRMTNDGIAEFGRASTLPVGWSRASASAALRIHPGGRFLYSSNRGHDSIAIFDVADATAPPRLMGTILSGGKVPRDFAIDPSGRMMVVAHQDSHDLRVFRIDPDNGDLDPAGPGAKLGSPVCVCFPGT